MRMFDREALQDGVAPREVAAWSLYDFANSGYTTVVLTAVFSAYFVNVVAEGADWATLAWTLALSFSSLLIMLTAPAIGAWADTRGSKKFLIALCTLGCVAGTLCLYFAQPGTVGLALFLIVVSNCSFSMGETFNASFLPDLAKLVSMGKLSEWGWGVGYFGGMLTLGLSLAWVINAQASGQSAVQFVPITMLITAAVFAVAALPFFFVLKERAVINRSTHPVVGIGTAIAASFRKLADSWRESQQFPDFLRLLICGFSYQAGISVVIALAAIYAEQVMGFVQSETMMLIFLVNIAAAVGAFTFGYAQDWLGHRLALAMTLIGWIVMVLLAGIGESVGLFWVAAGLAGFCMGSSQSAGRAIAGLLAPPARRAEFFGLWAFATRLSAVVGPVTYGLVTWLTSGNHRLAILITGLFFVGGLILLLGLNVERGRQAAIASSR